jgi:hypothetical protein
MTTGSIVVTVTAGVPTAVMTGTTLQDGTYTVNMNQDNSGTTISVATPYGAAQAQSIRQYQAVNP